MKKLSTSFIAILTLISIGMLPLLGCGHKKPAEKNIVPLSTARTRIGAYRNLIPGRDTASNDLRTRSFYYRSEAFTKSDLEAILSESGCDGIRIYHAVNEQGRSVMYILGKNSAGNDLLPDSTARNPAAAQVDNKGNYIISSEVPCPEMCPANGF